MKVVLFEDEKYRDLLPLVYFRPVWELRCGAHKLIEKMRPLFAQTEPLFLARDFLAENVLPVERVFRPDQPESVLFVNGCLLFRDDDLPGFDELPANQVLVSNDRVVAFRTENRSAERYFSGGVLLEERIKEDFQVRQTGAVLVRYPWDLISENGSQLRQDLVNLGELGKIAGTVDDGVIILGKENVRIAAGARVMPGVVIAAEDGPVYIDQNAVVMPNAVLEGPLYLGKNSRVKIGAKIYQDTTIGPVCKVGGEVEGSIIHSYSNKQHDGFLGHSYLAEWVNIGADTNNSDLKNTYGEITVFLNGSPIKTGKRFVGLIMGDHSKTGINTMFNTGTIVGVNSNVYGAGFPPKFIPSFSMGGSSGFREYNFEKALEVAEIVMSRRQVKFSEAHKKLFQAVRELAYQMENRGRVR